MILHKKQALFFWIGIFFFGSLIIIAEKDDVFRSAEERELRYKKMRYEETYQAIRTKCFDLNRIELKKPVDCHKMVSLMVKPDPTEETKRSKLAWFAAFGLAATCIFFILWVILYHEEKYKHVNFR